MNENRNMAFWTIKTGWPDDAYGYAFLGRAVNLVGKHLFGDAWTGEEPCAPAPYGFWKEFNGVPLPTHPLGRDGMSNADKEAAHRLLALHRPEFNRSPVIEYGHFGPIIPDFSPDEWLAAVELAKEENKTRNDARRRRNDTFNLLKEAMRDGQIAFALLPLKGGRFSENCDHSWWNTTDVASRFYMCQMNPDDPFGIGVAGDKYMHIFVRGDQLQALVQPQTNSGSQSPPVMRPASEETYQMAVNLLPSWFEYATRKTRDEFARHCAEYGIPSSSAREAYKSLGRKRGKKAVE